MSIEKQEKILITGESGFVGQHLAEYILSNKKIAKIYGLKRSYVDIRNTQAIKDLVKKVKPDKIFHLAAQSSVALSWQNPQETFETNVIGTINLLEAVKQSNPNPTLLLIGSSAQYGKVRESDNPLKEQQNIKPIDPYSISKQTQEFLGYQYFLLGLKIIMTRSFPHIGPGQGEKAIYGRWAKIIAQAEKDKKKSVQIELINPDNIRDFTDVRDVVKAYWLLSEKGRFGQVYNICSNKGYRMQDIAERLQNLSSIEVKIKKIKKPNNIPKIIGDNRKLKKATGWRPNINFFQKTLPDLLNYWRKKLK